MDDLRAALRLQAEFTRLCANALAFLEATTPNELKKLRVRSRKIK